MKTSILALSALLTIALAAATAVPPPLEDVVKTESSHFTIFKDGKKIGKEDFSIKARKGGGYIAEAKTKLNSDREELKSRMELDADLRPTYYEYQRSAGIIRMRIDKEVADYEVVSEGRTKTVKVEFPENGFIVDNNFFHHIQLLLNRLRRRSGQVTIIVPQDLRRDLVTVKETRPSQFEIEADITLQIVLDPVDGRLLRLSAPANGVVVER